MTVDWAQLRQAAFTNVAPDGRARLAIQTALADRPKGTRAILRKPAATMRGTYVVGSARDTASTRISAVTSKE